MIRYRLRLTVNALVGLIPRSILRGFLKVFLLRAELAEAAGFQVYPRTFDAPLPLLEEINFLQLNSRRSLPDIDLREAEALQFVEQLSRFTPELDPLPYDRPSGDVPFWFANESFTDFDAAALHTMLRYCKPKHYIELGCGFSSFVSSHALMRNAQEGFPCDIIYADPEPRRDLKQTLATGRFIQSRVQDLPLDLFKKLGPGDVLFIDTSHVLKIQSDVVRELLEILPALAPGVWIHLHDVFTPYDYPEDMLRKKTRLSCNEQYGVECLLSGGKRYQVALPLHLLWREHRDRFQKLFPRGKCRPHSFWIQKQGLTT